MIKRYGVHYVPEGYNGASFTLCPTCYEDYCKVVPQRGDKLPEKVNEYSCDRHFFNYYKRNGRARISIMSPEGDFVRTDSDWKNYQYFIAIHVITSGVFRVELKFEFEGMQHIMPIVGSYKARCFTDKLFYFVNDPVFLREFTFSELIEGQVLGKHLIPTGTKITAQIRLYSLTMLDSRTAHHTDFGDFTITSDDKIFPTDRDQLIDGYINPISVRFLRGEDITLEFQVPETVPLSDEPLELLQKYLTTKKGLLEIEFRDLLKHHEMQTQFFLQAFQQRARALKKLVDDILNVPCI